MQMIVGGILPPDGIHLENVNRLTKVQRPIQRESDFASVGDMPDNPNGFNAVLIPKTRY